MSLPPALHAVPGQDKDKDAKKDKAEKPKSNAPVNGKDGKDGAEKKREKAKEGLKEKVKQREKDKERSKEKDSSKARCFIFSSHVSAKPLLFASSGML